MGTNYRSLRDLFSQLGLASQPQAIDAFVASHSLARGTSLNEAPYWNPSQARFLSEAIAEDADWAVAVDELALRVS